MLCRTAPFAIRPDSSTLTAVQFLTHVQLWHPVDCSVCQACLSFTISQSSLKFMSIKSVMLSNYLIFYCPLLFPSNLSQHQGFFQWVSSSYQGVKLLKIQLQHPMNIQGWSPCSPRDSQESSPAPQFRSISSSALSLLYGTTLTPVHDYWENHAAVAVQSLSCVWLCDPMHCSLPGFPVLFYLSEFAQAYVHSVGDAIQPSHPSRSPPALNISQQQGLFQRVRSLHQVAKVLELKLKHQSFWWIFRVYFL